MVFITKTLFIINLFPCIYKEGQLFQVSYKSERLIKIEIPFNEKTYFVPLLQNKLMTNKIFNELYQHNKL